MEEKEIVCYIRNKMTGFEFDDIARALMASFDRTHPGYTLALVAIPKFDLEERKWILDGVYREVMEATFDEITGEPLITPNGQK